MLNIKTLQNIMRTDAGVNGDAQRIEQIIWILFLKMYDLYERKAQAEAKLSRKSYISIIPESLRWENWAKAYDICDGKPIAKAAVKTGDDLLDFVNNTLFPTLKNLSVSEDTPLSQKIVRKAFEDTNNYMKDGTALRQLINEIDKLEIKTKEDQKALSLTYETFLKALQSAGNAGEFYTPRAVTDFIMHILQPKIGDKIADLACGTGGFLISAYHYLEEQIQSAQDRESLNQSFYGIEKKALPFILCATNFLINGIDNPNLDHANSFDTAFDDIKPAFDIIAMNPPYGGSENDSVKSTFPTEYRSSETADLFMAMITQSLKQGGKAAVVLPDGFLFGDDTAKINIKKRLLDEFNLHLIVRLPKGVFAPYTSITTNILFFDKAPQGTKETWFYRLDIPFGWKTFSKTRQMKPEYFEPFFEWNKNRSELSDENGNPKAAKFSKAELIAKNHNLDLCGYLEAKDEILPTFEFISGLLQQGEKFNTDLDSVLGEIKSILERNR
ncbi:MAG: SAM-dependent DNA methyltransferase [Neisseriaceae bacterium]|nr:SAM-dependent DNA methyltransferase [Neisseriaceae bacterium]